MNQAFKLLCVVLTAAMLASGLTLEAAIANSDRLGGKSELTQNVARPLEKRSSITVVGVLRYLPLEGGCYQIETATGQKFEPLGNFPKQNGTTLRVRGQLLTDVVTICQVGQPLQVESVQVLQ